MSDTEPDTSAPAASADAPASSADSGEGRRKSRKAGKDTAEPTRAMARWETHFWGRRRGHQEELELTETVKRAAVEGRLTLVDAGGEPLTVTVPPLPQVAPGGRRTVPRRPPRDA